MHNAYPSGWMNVSKAARGKVAWFSLAIVPTLSKQTTFRPSILFSQITRRRWLTLLLIFRVTAQSSVYLRLWGKPLCKYLSLQPAVLWDRIFLYILLHFYFNVLLYECTIHKRFYIAIRVHFVWFILHKLFWWEITME